jgi:hypothetical protein
MKQKPLNLTELVTTAKAILDVVNQNQSDHDDPIAAFNKKNGQGYSSANCIERCHTPCDYPDVRAPSQVRRYTIIGQPSEVSSDQYR